MMDLIPSSLVWKVGNVGVQLFLGCIRSQMAKESISSMPDLGRRPSLSILFALDVVATTFLRLRPIDETRATVSSSAFWHSVF